MRTQRIVEWHLLVGISLIALVAVALPAAADIEDASEERVTEDTSVMPSDESSSAEVPEAVVTAPATTDPVAATIEAQPGPAGGAGLISVDFKDADIRQVLRIISLKSGVDIVAGPDVEGLVTIKLTNVPWEQALDIILRTYGFTYERKTGIVRVMTMGALEQEALATEVFPLDYAKAKDVPDVIKEMLSERGRVKFDERTNTVIVTDIPTNLFQIKEVVGRIDQRTPQAFIETKIVETKLEKNEHLGIRWMDSVRIDQSASIYPSSFPFPSASGLGEFGETFINRDATKIGGSANLTTVTTSSVNIGRLTGPALSATLNFLRQRSDTRIVSNPTLAVLNNQTASILIGEEYPVPQFSLDPNTGNTTVSGFETRELGTVLKVTPHVNPSEEIVVDLEPEVSTALDPVSFSVSGSASVGLPRFSTQKVKTSVRIANGETIAIGGLIKNSKVVTENRVPVLGDIPIIGGLFRNKHTFGGGENPSVQQDLLIFLTVKLMDEGPAKDQVAAEPGL